MQDHALSGLGTGTSIKSIGVNLVLWPLKAGLNSNGQQFYQYHTITSHLKSCNIIKTMTYDVGNPCPFLELAQKWLNKLYRSQTYPS